MTHTELLKQALEALKPLTVNAELRGDNLPEGNEIHKMADAGFKSITGINEYLAQPVQEPVAVDTEGENKAVRCFLMFYGQPGLTVGQMKKHMTMSGFTSWPTWVDIEPKGAHLTKAGAQLWIRHLFSLEATPPAAPVQQAPAAWYESTAELAAVYGEMCAINETKRDDQTPEQAERLLHLRAECVATHKKRIALNTSPSAQPAPTCTRSHPHENMDTMCELRTEIARLTNENARLKAQPAPVQEPDKYFQLALEALAPLEKLFVQADEQGLLGGANVDCQIATSDLRKSAYAASDIRAYLNTTPIAAQPAPVQEPLPSHEIVTMYEESPTSDSDMIAFARSIEAAHGISGERK